MGLIPGWGTKIPQAEQWGQKKKEREREKENKLNAQQGMGSRSQPLMLWNSMYNSGQLNWAGLHTKGASLRYRSRVRTARTTGPPKEGRGERTVE